MPATLNNTTTRRNFISNVLAARRPRGFQLHYAFSCRIRSDHYRSLSCKSVRSSFNSSPSCHPLPAPQTPNAIFLQDYCFGAILYDGWDGSQEDKSQKAAGRIKIYASVTLLGAPIR